MYFRFHKAALLGVAIAASVGTAATAQMSGGTTSTMGSSSTTAPGGDVMATPASPDSSMLKGSTGRKHMKKTRSDRCPTLPSPGEMKSGAVTSKGAMPDDAMMNTAAPK